MTPTPCELIATFVTTPEAAADAVREHLPDLLRHLDECPRCAELLERVDDPERLFGLLAGPESDEQAREVEKAIHSDLAREDFVRGMIREVLLSGLAPELRARIEELDPLVLHGVAEAASLLMRDVVRRHRDAEPVCLELTQSGEVYLPGAGEPAIDAETMALEIARFTGLWEGNRLREEPRVSAEARVLVDALHPAAAHLPGLFRHVRVSELLTELKPNYGRLRLLPLTPGEWIQDPVERWQRRQRLEVAIGALPYGGSERAYQLFAPSENGEGWWDALAAIAAEGLVFSTTRAIHAVTGDGVRSQVLLGQRTIEYMDLGVFDITFGPASVQLSRNGEASNVPGFRQAGLLGRRRAGAASAYASA